MSVIDLATNYIYEITGSFVLNTGPDFVGDTVTGYSFTDGVHKLEVSCISLTCSSFLLLTNSDNVIDIYNSLGLSGQDTITGG